MCVCVLACVCVRVSSSASVLAFTMLKKMVLPVTFGLVETFLGPHEEASLEIIQSMKVCSMNI